MLLFDRNKLISAVYSATVSPESYDETLDAIDDVMFGASSFDIPTDIVSGVGMLDTRNSERTYTTDPDLVAHFQRAYDIQLRIGRPRKGKSKILLLLDAAPNPAYITDRNEKILAMNGHAQASSQGRSEKLSDCITGQEILADIRAFISGEGAQKVLIVPGYINPEMNTNTCILVRKIDEIEEDGVDSPDAVYGECYFVTIVNLGFDHSKTELFRKTYGLTAAEVEIAILLSSGKQIQEIAVERGATIATIRTQIKAIKSKTDSRDIPALVRLLCGFSAGILISSQVGPSETTKDLASQMKILKHITLRDGRKMGYMEQGSPSGMPVLMIHNSPYGVDMPEAAIAAATRLNLRILTPFRPGFGSSDLNKAAHGDTLLREVAIDFQELLNQLAISKIAVVGHAIGSCYAVRFASLYPERVTQVIAVARAPIWREAWADEMPKRQRFMMRIAKYFPQLLLVIATATTMYIDNGNGEKLVNSLCSESPGDMKALQNPETMDLMVRGCIDGLRQGADAFCRDVRLALLDMSQEARTMRHPLHILHGDSDGIIDVSHSQAFVDAVPGSVLEVVQGAGQLLFYSHWERIFNAVKTRQKNR
jgi:pimeloyl-ACP methyl ester carboxylesterase/DNA-binding CsgD family transcriptional regulator